jgi:hypothetical protein
MYCKVCCCMQVVSFERSLRKLLLKHSASHTPPAFRAPQQEAGVSIDAELGAGVASGIVFGTKRLSQGAPATAPNSRDRRHARAKPKRVHDVTPKSFDFDV